jgi:ferric-dicitrate binding protein FerR (iron transport regulator)
MKNQGDPEIRVLEFLEGELSPEEAARFLADAERDPGLADLLHAYEKQGAALAQFYDPKRADRLVKPLLPPRAEPTNQPVDRWLWIGAAAAAAAVVMIGGTLWWSTESGGALQERYRMAEVISTSGRPVIRLAAAQMEPLERGREFAARRETIRTPVGTRAFVEIAGRSGRGFELNGGSTVTVARDRRGSQLELEHGELIVWALDQPSSSISVRTPDLHVTGSDAVFSVVRGMRGAEVAVVRGQVEVTEGTQRRLLRGGERYSTTSAEPVSLAQRVSWSTRHDSLGTLPATQIEEAPTPPPGLPSLEELARYLPESTFTFVAGESTAEVLRGLRAEAPAELLTPERVDEATELFKILGSTPNIEAISEATRQLLLTPGAGIFLDSLQGSFVLAVHSQGVLLIARQAPGSSSITPFVEETLRPLLHSVETERPLTADAVRDYLLIGNDGTEYAETRSRLAEDKPSPFGATLFFRSVVRDARRGTFTVAMDGGALLRQAETRNPQFIPILERLGLHSMQSLVASNGFSDQAMNRAVRLTFGDDREGVAGWLAEPAPFTTAGVTGPAPLVYIAAQTREPATILGQWLSWLDEDGVGGTIPTELAPLAATLGTEIALSVERPLFPIPNARLAVEVVDGDAFLDRLADLLGALDRSSRSPGQLAIRQVQWRGYRMVAFEHPVSGLPFAVTVVRGNAIMAMGRPMLQAAIEQIESGKTLENEPAYRAALPGRSGSHASLLIYHQPGQQGGELEALAGMLGVQRAATGALDQAPTVLYAVAGEDRIDLFAEGVRGGLDVGRMLGVAAPVSRRPSR